MDDQKRLVMAIVISGIILFGWQAFFAPKTLPINQNPTTNTKVINNTTETSKGNDSSNSEVKGAVQSDKLPAKELVDQTFTSAKHSDLSVVLNSEFQLKSVSNDQIKYGLATITGNENGPKILVEHNGRYEPLYFESFKQQNDGSYSATDLEKGITLNAFFTEDKFFQVQLNSTRPYRYQFVLPASPFDPEKSEIEARYGILREFLIFSNETERINVGEEESGAGKKIKWFGLDFNYHLLAFVFDEKLPLNYKSTLKGDLVLVTSDPVAAINTKYIYTRKDYGYLSTIGHNLTASVDFGVFAILAIPILKGLKISHDLIPNYGVAIIILTILIRLLTFPLQYKSYKSMKKMQVLQPEMAKLKEKFKDDPQRMQKETMELFKRSGANPLGGCLPLLAQMPFFFAFYQVLYNAVELVDAPFIGWVTDLSAKDPYYVLPVLMSITMLAQQKFMPTTAGTDPTQKKIMMFMPVVFGFIMKDLPSGLTLYIFISTLFGIGQQALVYRTTD